MVTGGVNGPVLNDLWVWNSQHSSWTPMTQSKLVPSPRAVAGAVVVGHMMYLFGGDNFEVAFNDCWKLDLVSYLWDKIGCKNPPPARSGHGMVLIDPNTILMFGGGGSDKSVDVFNDTWLWHLDTHTWENITSSPSPAPRFQFTLENFAPNNSAVLYGGWNPARQFADGDIWAFSTITMRWRQLQLSNETFYPQNRTLQASNMIGCQKMLVSGGLIGAQRQKQSPSSDTFSGFFVDENTWRWQLLDATGMEPRFGHFLAVPHQSDDHCFNLNASNFNGYQGYANKTNSYESFNVLGRGVSWTLKYLVQQVAAGCNRGSAASSFSDECVQCPIGAYSDVAGAQVCQSCPTGLSTQHIGSVSIVNCSVCVPGYCQNGGNCIISALQGTLAPLCSCSILFSAASRCEELSTTGIIILSGVAGAIVLLGGIGVYVLYKRKLRRQRAQAREQQNRFASRLKQQEQDFEKAWRIDYSQLEILSTLAEGAFGEVLEAKWGDRTVAVKKHER